MATISERIFELMKKQGMTQKGFSQVTGIAESTISDWKKKGTNPVSDKIMTICNAFNVTPEYLLSGKNDNKRSVGAVATKVDTDSYVVKKDSELGKLITAYNEMSAAEKKKFIASLTVDDKVIKVERSIKEVKEPKLNKDEAKREKNEDKSASKKDAKKLGKSLETNIDKKSSKINEDKSDNKKLDKKSKKDDKKDIKKDSKKESKVDSVYEVAFGNKKKKKDKDKDKKKKNKK